LIVDSVDNGGDSKYLAFHRTVNAVVVSISEPARRF